VSKQIDQLRALLDGAESIAILSHIRPDGDAVGSVLALSLSLAEHGKHVTPVLIDGVPERFRFLPAAETIVQTLPDGLDLLVAVDCADLQRTGLPADVLRQPDINIDHHPTNTRYAALNIVEPAASATAEILYDLLAALSLPINPDVASNLLAGIVMDTIGFRTDSVAPRLLRMAADLMERGAVLHEIYLRGLEQRSLTEIRYWERGLAKLSFEAGLIWTSLTPDDRQSVGYPGKDDADLINLLSVIEGARVSVVFVEQPQGEIKVSWRSRDGLDVSSVARQFGGGGHKPAAGATIQGKLEEVQKRVLSATRDLLHRTPGMEIV
jgi:phosphoesterase RecJ-like protein